MLSETYEPFKPKGRLERVMETSTCAIFVTRGAGALDEELALAWRLALNLGAMEQAQGGSTEEGMLANESTWRPRRGRMHSHTSMNAVPHRRQATCRPPVRKISRASYVRQSISTNAGPDMASVPSTGDGVEADGVLLGLLAMRVSPVSPERV